MTNDARPTTGPQKTRKISVIQDRNRATLAHFGGILGILPSAAVFYVSRRNAPFAEQEAFEAMNFTLVPSLLIVVCFILGFVPGLGNIALCWGCSCGCSWRLLRYAPALRLIAVSRTATA